MDNIASVLFTQGKDNHSLKIYRELKEKSDIDVRLVKHKIDVQIGLLLCRQGKHDEALEIFSRQYNLVKEGKIYSDGTVEHNLGVVLFYKSDCDGASKMYEKALKRKEEVLGSDHKDTLNTKCNLALVLGKHDCVFLIEYTKKYDEALRIANEVDKEREKLFPDNPRTLKGKFLIVRILNVQGKYDEALEKCKEVYEKRKEILGPNHIDTLNTLHNLALILAKQRKYDKALGKLNEILKEKEKILKLNHPSILQTKGVIDVVCRARNNGADINIKCIYQKLERDLHRAAQEGQLDVVNALLNRDADVNLEDFEGWTPLHCAAQNGHLDVVNALLNKGADVNKINNNQGVTPLYLAIQNGHKNIVEILLKVKDININVKTDNGVTQLHSAAKNGNNFNNKNVIKVLLENGAHIDVKNNDGKTPLYYATNDSIKKILASTKKLFTQVKKGDLQKTKDCLSKGAVVNAQGTDGDRPLHYAAWKGYVEDY
ncbi:uncharacterized protein [Temnothorax nylanderi]|uniref:uncharacterized protein n=1 Tax=Temnothorax nylanderi TaxID=102681 RepID=UPI003A849BE2